MAECYAETRERSYSECEERLAENPDPAAAGMAPRIANYVLGMQSAGSRLVLWFRGIPALPENPAGRPGDGALYRDSL
jgi:hypothetical protein